MLKSFLFFSLSFLSYPHATTGCHSHLQNTHDHNHTHTHTRTHAHTHKHTLSIVLQRPFSDSGLLQSNCGLWDRVFALPKYSTWKIQLFDLQWVFYLKPNNFPVLGVKSDVWNLRWEEIRIDSWNWSQQKVKHEMFFWIIFLIK